jgi:hypothetical protein
MPKRTGGIIIMGTITTTIIMGIGTVALTW